MGLLRKIFGKGDTEPTQFRDSAADPDQPTSSNASRRELVHTALRDVMRNHAIPRDWIDCRMLSVQNANHKPAIHVQFIVLKGEEQLLDYVHAFQDGFWREVEGLDPKVRDWLLSVAWQFEGNAKHGLDDMPKFQGWDEDSDAAVDTVARDPLEQDTQPHADHEEDLRSDLAQLYAIRDAALMGASDGDADNGGPTLPGKKPPR